MTANRTHHRRNTNSKTHVQETPHGVDVFQSHWNCQCARCAKKRAAVHRLVDSFSQIPADWIRELAEHQGETLAIPMWGTVFAPHDGSDAAAIRRLCRPIAGAEGDADMESLTASGWEAVAETGILAVTFDEVLLLGIHGAGYDFYADHWEPLYNALGYHWHR